MVLTDWKSLLALLPNWKNQQLLGQRLDPFLMSEPSQGGCGKVLRRGARTQPAAQVPCWTSSFPLVFRASSHLSLSPRSWPVSVMDLGCGSASQTEGFTGLGQWAVSEDIFKGHSWDGTVGIWWTEARGLAKYPMMHSAAPQQSRAEPRTSAVLRLSNPAWGRAGRPPNKALELGWYSLLSPTFPQAFHKGAPHPSFVMASEGQGEHWPPPSLQRRPGSVQQSRGWPGTQHMGTWALSPVLRTPGLILPSLARPGQDASLGLPTPPQAPGMLSGPCNRWG